MGVCNRVCVYMCVCVCFTMLCMKMLINLCVFCLLVYIYFWIYGYLCIVCFSLSCKALWVSQKHCIIIIFRAILNEKFRCTSIDYHCFSLSSPEIRCCQSMKKQRLSCGMQLMNTALVMAAVVLLLSSSMKHSGAIRAEQGASLMLTISVALSPCWVLKFDSSQTVHWGTWNMHWKQVRIRLTIL